MAETVSECSRVEQCRRTMTDVVAVAFAGDDRLRWAGTDWTEPTEKTEKTKTKTDETTGSARYRHRWSSAKAFATRSRRRCFDGVDSGPCAVA